MSTINKSVHDSLTFSLFPLNQLFFVGSNSNVLNIFSYASFFIHFSVCPFSFFAGMCPPHLDVPCMLCPVSCALAG